MNYIAAYNRTDEDWQVDPAMGVLWDCPRQGGADVLQHRVPAPRAVGVVVVVVGSERNWVLWNVIKGNLDGD